MVVLGWLFGIAVAAAVIAVAVLFLNRFYRKSTRDIALVRTGFGGQRILISGGCLALPFLHRIEEINMRTLRIEVRRTAEKSLITEDRMRVDVELEFYVRVTPVARRHRDRRAGARRQILHARGHAQPAGRPLRRRDPRGRGRPHHGFAARAPRRFRAQHLRPAARESEPERHPARLGLAHPARPVGLLGLRREQRLQRGRPAQARRDHRGQQEEARRDRGRRRDRGAPDPARGDQAPPAAEQGRGAGADQPAARDREGEVGERSRGRQGARNGDDRLGGRAHRARAGDQGHGSRQAARGAQARARTRSSASR